MQKILDTSESRTLSVGEDTWPQVSDRSMILRSDMAYELGARGFPPLAAPL